VTWETDPAPPELIVIVQCESFGDPVEITGEAHHALPGLASAREVAWQWGDLDVSGFGAYTMRTEYGVLFGRSEGELGFRRYDPFLSAQGETSYALPARLREAGYHCSFVHPHDLRFYNRDRLMPALGFDRMIGEEGFPPTSSRGGRYVDDRTLGASLAELLDKAAGPTLIYAVTMENHGPWDSDNARDARGRLEAYLHRLQSSDAMLSGLVERLRRDGRSALLVFFGDHRPSIPGATAPGGARHTPYVIVRFDADGSLWEGGPGRTDLSPAALHHAILRCVQEDGATMFSRSEV
jgi:phosphoglycerol transferase MdoB-like AlkP superfamily enzyme